MNRLLIVITIFLLGCLSSAFSKAQTNVQKVSINKYNWLGQYETSGEQVEY